MTNQQKLNKVILSTAIAGTVASLGFRPTHQESTTKKTNVLFILTDDQRAGTINALGNDEVYTPNLDLLVQSGTSYTNAYIMGSTVAAVCAPSRAMLLTGRPLFNLPNDGTQPTSHDFFPADSLTTMPEHFRNQGYITFGTGKQHNGHRLFARSFTDGAEIFFGGMGDHWNVFANHFDPEGKYDTWHRYIRDPFSTNKVFKVRCDHIPHDTHSSELFTDATIKFLDEYDGENPFFAYCAYMAPHDPRSMPEEYLEMYDTANISIPPNFMPEHPFDNGELKIRDELLAGFPRTKEEIKIHIRDYYAMITHLDAQIGRIIHKLKEKNVYENTLIILCGDNGLALGQHGLLGKQNLYKHSINVPLILSGPGIPANEKREATCYLFDIFPTLCDLLEIEKPSSVMGKSFIESINTDNPGRDDMFFVYKDYMRAAIEENYKLIEYRVNGEKHTQLFDLTADPYETDDLSRKNDYQGIKKEMQKKLSLLRDHYKDTLDFRIE